MILTYGAILQDLWNQRILINRILSQNNVDAILVKLLGLEPY